ncbi:MAG: glycosyltransferase family 4 protein [Thermoplasmataceae archaeon]
MKILWLAHRDPLNPKAGGAERIVYEVGKRLATNGNEVTIFSGGWKNCRKYDELHGIHIIRVGYRIGPHLKLPILLFKNNYDIVIADLGHAVPWILPILLRRTIVSFLHLHARSLPGQVGKLLSYSITAIEKLYFIIYHKSNFVTISKTSMDDLVSIGINANKISLINPGVNSNLFCPRVKTEHPTIVYFGGMRPYKRPEEALYVLSDLLREIPSIELKMIGDGPSRKGLEKLCAELNLMNNVQFIGRISDEKVSEIVASSWLNIHCSATEGWGISIIEASAAGTPTIAYEVPGIVDTIENGINGIKVKDGDRVALTKSAIEILSNPDKWWLSSIEVAKKYSWDRTAELWDKLIHEILNE